MENQEDILIDATTPWGTKEIRIGKLQEEKEQLPFGYDLLYDSLDAVRECLMAQNVGLAGFVLGRLVQRLEDNKDFFNEE